MLPDKRYIITETNKQESQMLALNNREWVKSFNLVMKGYVRELKNIIPEHVNATALAKAIMDVRNQYRRDVMNRGQQVPFNIESMEAGIRSNISLSVEDFNWTTSRGTYTAQDYSKSVTLDQEELTIEAIEAYIPQVRAIYNSYEPRLEDKVRIHMSIGHFYQHQQGIIKQTRADGKFLVHILTKSPLNTPKVGGPALVWVSAAELEIL